MEDYIIVDTLQLRSIASRCMIKQGYTGIKARHGQGSETLNYLCVTLQKVFIKSNERSFSVVKVYTVTVVVLVKIG